MGKHSKPVPERIPGEWRPNTTVVELFGDRQSGKTEMVCRYAYADILFEGRKVVYVSRTHAESREAFHRMRALFAKLPVSPDALDRSFEFRNSGVGTEIRFGDHAKMWFESYRGGGRWRGAHVDTVIFDAFDTVPNRDVLVDVMPALAMSRNPKLVVATCA
ncbi:AAA-ATPase [Gordonia phage Trax]|uniref:AAA-ATPase n=1 Tax=Gordonia phage Trax TaxID=2591121 RepID=A0A515MH57_9CAUD|nr:AAA-ATPase [Gordonia phage Trax]QDM55999.1 AAA-ATPase [Gordonia phage Trax]